MKVLCFSSFTFGYLDRARVLFSSVRRYHPDWHLVALIVDRPPPGFELRLDQEDFDEVVYASQLGIEALPSWLFRHDIVEVCTAVKGPFLYKACLSGVDAVVYLDPDTCLFADLSNVIQLLHSSDVVLTPHQLTPDTERTAIVDNEITSLKTGIYNLGFLAVRAQGEGLAMAHWWAERLLSFCYDDPHNGLFVDQRWADHIPSFFQSVFILRDPGYNVASWNLSQRSVAIEKDGRAYVNGSPLRFWHFTKLGPVGDLMTKRYAGDSFAVHELWRWYRNQVLAAAAHGVPAGYWAFGRYANGVSILRSHRLLYRHRRDLQEAFPDPFACGPESLYRWLLSEGHTQEEARSLVP